MEWGRVEGAKGGEGRGSRAGGGEEAVRGQSGKVSVLLMVNGNYCYSPLLFPRSLNRVIASN